MHAAAAAASPAMDLMADSLARFARAIADTQITTPNITFTMEPSPQTNAYVMRATVEPLIRRRGAT